MPIPELDVRTHHRGLGFSEDVRKRHMNTNPFNTTPNVRTISEAITNAERARLGPRDYGEDWPIAYYTWVGTGSINPDLRDDNIGGPVSGLISKRLNELPEYRGTVYRGIKSPGSSKTSARIDAMKPGDIYEDRGFMSTSPDLDPARKFRGSGFKGEYVMAIRTKQRGTKARNISHISPFAKALDMGGGKMLTEVLFDKGSRLRFVGKQKMKTIGTRKTFLSDSIPTTVYLFEEVN